MMVRSGKLRLPLYSLRCCTLSLVSVVLLGFCPGTELLAESTSAAVAIGPEVTSSELAGSAVIERIDALIQRAWQENGVKPSSEATDAQWCRRVYLDLIGRVPTVAELADYTRAHSPAKQAELVDRLLGQDYHDEYVRHWSAYWTNLLIGRTGGTQRRSITSREGMREFLASCLETNKPYDQLVHELLTATGTAMPGEEAYSGAANFLVEKLQENGVQATAKTAQIFLGMAVQCTQCHNHPFNEYRQNQFWELNAFFRQTRTQVMRDPENDRRRISSVVNRDFAGEGRGSLRDNRSEIFLEQRDGKLVDRDAAGLSAAPLYYALRNGQVRVAYPVFIDGTSLAEKYADQGVEFGNSGALDRVDRREELAELILQSPQFDVAIANRLWGHFLGYGFTKPVDDMGPHNSPSHPELSQELGRAFRVSGFDLKSLMRWIVLSRPYGLSSQIGRSNKKDDPTLGVAPLFSRFYVRQMQPEQLYESLLISTQADATVAEDQREQMKQRWISQFVTAFGTDDNAEASTFNGSIPQTLMMMNGELIRRACSTGSGSFLDRVATDPQLSNREKIDYLYRAALSRRPTKEETSACNQLLDSRGGNVVNTLQDVWWAVLNSNEFILIH